MAKRFSTAPVTAPSAGEPVTPAAAQPAAVRAAQPAAGSTAPTSAFTWRQTIDQADDLDALARQLRRELGRRVDKATALAALVAAALERDDVRAAAIAALQRSEDQAA